MLEAVLTVVIIVFVFCLSISKPKKFPPGPNIWTIIKHFPEVNADNQAHFDQLYREYGGVCGYAVPMYKLVMIGGYDAIKEVLANEDCQGRPDVCLLRDRFEGGHNYGVLFTSGEDWKAQRRFTLHHFRNLGFGKKTHEGIVELEAQDLVSEMHKLCKNPFTVEELLYLSNINVTWALVASKRYKHADPKLKLIGQCIKNMIHDSKVVGGVAVIFPLLRYVFPEFTGYNAVVKGGSIMREFIQEITEEHIKTRDPDNPRDFIDHYLNEIEELKRDGTDSSFSIGQMEGVCMDLLLAGGDTGTNTLTFAMLFLCLHQNIQQKIHEEIVSVVGPHRTPLVSDRSRFTYMEAFFMEMQRLRTVVPTLVPHRATKATTLSGYSIPKDSMLFINVKTIFMDKEHWGDPETFRPERFITPEGKLVKDDWLMPFGKGKRSCIGENLAKMSSLTVLAHLVQSFVFTLPPQDPIPSTEGHSGFLLGPPKFRIQATPRKYLEQFVML